MDIASVFKSELVLSPVDVRAGPPPPLLSLEVEMLKTVSEIAMLELESRSDDGCKLLLEDDRLEDALVTGLLLLLSAGGEVIVLISVADELSEELDSVDDTELLSEVASLDDAL